MKKILTIVTIAFLCNNAAWADSMNTIRPSASPLMQTIQQNESQRTLIDGIDKEKTKEKKLKELKEESAKELRNNQRPVDDTSFKSEDKDPLTRKEARMLAKQKKADLYITDKAEARKAREEAIIQDRLQRQLRYEAKMREKTGIHYKDESQIELASEKKRKDKNDPEKYIKVSDEYPGLKIKITKDVDEPKIYVQKIVFSPSEVFSDNELQEMANPLFHQEVTMTDIKNLINKINRSYIINDYVTSRAYLPPQQIKDGVLQISLFEGKIGEIIVRGNSWTRTSYITKRMGVEEGELFKLRTLENGLIKFNNDNYDYTKNPLSIQAKLVPGKVEGTTDIIVDANDPLPFHVTAAYDNAGRDTIGLTRGGVILSDDSLTGNRDKLSVGGYFGRGTKIGFADYNIPVNKYGTRVGASFSYNHIDVIKGSFRPFDISGNSFVYTGYVTHPIINRPDFSLNTYTAGNYKTSKTFFGGYPIFDTTVYSGTQGLTLRKDTKKGIWYTGHYGSVGYYETQSEHDVFFKYEGNLTRLHDFGHGIIGQFRVSGQVSPNDTLPWLEQFQIGGLSNVRGYSEGLLIGKSGFFLSSELITPIPLLPKKIGTEKLGFINLREMVKGALFFDFGAIFPYKGQGGKVDDNDFLASIGPGLRIRVNDELTARVYWGFGLIQNRYEMRQPSGRLHFELTMAPDISKMLKYRNFRETKPEKL